MNSTWIVSADRGRARIFLESDRNKPLQEIEDMVSPSARTRTSDEYTDRIGTFAGGKSIHKTGGHLPSSQYEPPTTPDEHETEVFAKEVCGYLLKGKQEGRFDKLALVAAPGFLGSLRNELDAQLKPLVSYEINKDYTHSNGQQLRELIDAHNSKQ
ncbi:host attachment protein [Massilia sp. PAMC28688]|uniref:host attachment protein n=1 Tax=Massilia sp. PAMC28688 TaxID=2861283 RepID=UPI001C63A09B|nr:host attachment protein [Massilia sp. PAMC28688]QYF94679.1 host attachment protein [Massilia sp. PAMC28688]